MRSSSTSRATPTRTCTSAILASVETQRYVLEMYCSGGLSLISTQTLAAASALGKTLSKAVYVFSPDEESGKVAHLNYLPKDIVSSKKLDAKTWLGEVSKIIGGKVRPRHACANMIDRDDAEIWNREVERTTAPPVLVARCQRSKRPSRRPDECTRRGLRRNVDAIGQALLPFSVEHQHPGAAECIIPPNER